MDSFDGKIIVGSEEWCSFPDAGLPAINVAMKNSGRLALWTAARISATPTARLNPDKVPAPC